MSLNERVIRGDACIAEGAAWLAVREERFAYALARTGPLPLRLRGDGFVALLDAICAQQISVAAADAVWRKLERADLTSAQRVAGANEEDLRACGLSRQKTRYARALATSGIDYAALRDLPSSEVIKELTKVTGIGRWTAEIYAMFSLGRADVFAAGDLALQESVRMLFEMELRPKEKDLIAISQAWSPWRGVAARLLWDYYRIQKGREGVKQ
ncbi:MAG: DNA-3-methyladenine glycosylase 2 family protein [Pseudomonadota bacterium]